MKDQNLELKNHILQYGGILGGISVVFGLMLYSLDMHYQNDSNATIVSLVITLGVIAYAQFAYRKDNENFMSLGQAIKIGLGMAAVSGIINVIYFLFLSNILDPEMMNKALEMGLNEFMDQNPEASDEMIEQVKGMQQQFTGPVITSSIIIIFSLLTGLVVSFITGLFLKHNRPE